MEFPEPPYFYNSVATCNCSNFILHSSVPVMVWAQRQGTINYWVEEERKKRGNHVLAQEGNKLLALHLAITDHLSPHRLCIFTCKGIFVPCSALSCISNGFICLTLKHVKPQLEREVIGRKVNGILLGIH